MKKSLVDVNMVLDVLLDRKPHVEASAAVRAVIEAGARQGLLAGHAVTTIHYLIRKGLGAAKARRTMAAILRVFGVAAIDGAVIQEALELPLPDFEDAVTSAAARFAGCDYIVTRDLKSFRGSPIRCLTPEAAAPLLDQA